MSSRSATPRSMRAALLGAAVAGLAGLAPGVAGGPDPVATLSWLATIATGAGWLVGASGVRAFPHALAVPGAWALVLFLSVARGARELSGPLFALGVVAGLFLAGHGLGRLCGRPCAGAGACIFLTLCASGAAVQGGFGENGAQGTQRSWASEHPELARAALALSPLVLVLEAGGWDVTRVHPRFYRSSGVEWFPRRPWQGRLAAALALVVGSLLSVLCALVRRKRRGVLGTADDHPA